MLLVLLLRTGVAGAGAGEVERAASEGVGHCDLGSLVPKIETENPITFHVAVGLSLCLDEKDLAHESTIVTCIPAHKALNQIMSYNSMETPNHVPVNKL